MGFREASLPVNAQDCILSIVEVYCRLSRYLHAQAFRSAARHARPADPENHRARAAAWMGNREANPDALWRRARGGPGLALPGSPPARTARLDRSGMEGFRPRAPRKGLLVNAGRPKATAA